MYTIQNEYTTGTGKKYCIRNLHFDNLQELGQCSASWKLVHVSHQTSSGDFMGDKYLRFSEGALIYQDCHDSSKGIKIYADYADYLYTYYDDMKFLSLLQERQRAIRLTEFPTGVVTIKDKIIGQEIPYYDGYVQIDQFFLNHQEEPYSYYLMCLIKIIDILQELIDNGIYYTDVHAGNFLINPLNDDLKLIDFGSTFISFNDGKNNKYANVVKNLKFMLDKLGVMVGLDWQDDLNNVSDLQVIKEIIHEHGKKLIKKR